MRLANTYVDDTTTVHLTELKGLRNLDLSNTKISWKTLKLIPQLPRLNYLNISGCNVAYKDLISLAEMQQLRRVTLSKGWIDPEDVDRVIESMPHLEVDLI